MVPGTIPLSRKGGGCSREDRRRTARKKSPLRIRSGDVGRIYRPALYLCSRYVKRLINSLSNEFMIKSSEHKQRFIDGSSA